MSKAPLPARRALSLPENEGSGVEESDISAAETAQYIAEFTAELSMLARQSRLDLLAYLLDMTRLEATRAVQAAAKRR